MDETNIFLLKDCMKTITRKDAVLKITALAQKNMEPVKPINKILDTQVL